MLEIDPKFMNENADLAVLSLLEGNPATARKLFLERGVEVGVLMADYDLGETEQALKSIDEMAARQGKANPYAMARAFAWVGEKSKAIEWLDRSLVGRNYGIKTFTYDPVLRSLHGEPGFALLKRKLGLPEPPATAER